MILFIYHRTIITIPSGAAQASQRSSKSTTSSSTAWPRYVGIWRNLLRGGKSLLSFLSKYRVYQYQKSCGRHWSNPALSKRHYLQGIKPHHKYIVPRTYLRMSGNPFDTHVEKGPSSTYGSSHSPGSSRV